MVHFGFRPIGAAQCSYAVLTGASQSSVDITPSTTSSVQPSGSSSGSTNSTAKCFPSNFLFGSATTSYQVEGAVNETGRTPSVWDEICGGDSFPNCANVADDFFHRYLDDIDTMKNDGYGSMRFSISWSRAMNWNSTLQRMQPNPEGLAFYHSLVDNLIANGIEPLLTLFHWDMPVELYSAGDLLNTTIIDHFKDYAELIFTEFGQQVKYWSTINEPLSYMYIFYIYTGTDSDEYEAAHNLLLAHAEMVALFRRLQEQGIVQSTVRIGLVLSGFGIPYDEAANNVDAAERFNPFNTGWFLAPLATGDYPPMMRERVGSRLPNFTNEEAALVKGSYDLIMINHYLSTAGEFNRGGAASLASQMGGFRSRRSAFS